MIQNNLIYVYIKVDSVGNVLSVDSSVFLTDLSGWIKIDEGYGDKYAHAQNNYFTKPLRNMDGSYNYQCIDNTVFDRGII